MLAVPGGAHHFRSDPSDQRRAAASQSSSGDLGVARNRAAELVWFLSAIALVVAAGVIRLDVPLHGDPALFLLYARRMSEGFRLYVDFWDVKPPAIFAFYEVGGELFGFTDRGVHLLDLLWMGALAVVMMVGLAPRLHHRWAAAVAPMASIAVYYALCGAEAQTQVEALVNLPACLCVLALARAGETRSGGAAWSVFAGVAAALATVFKVIFAPIFIALVLVTTVSVFLRARSAPVRHVLVGLWLPFTVGVVAVWTAVVLLFAARGTADALLWTLFTYPLQAIGSVDYAPLKRLVVDLRMVVGAFAPWLTFAVVAVPLAWRRGGPLIVRLTVTWLVMAVVVILLQRTSWWFYHFMLLMAPIGVLAAFGVDRATAFIARRASLSPLQAMGIGCLLVLPALGSLAAPLGETLNGLVPSLLPGGKPIESFKDRFEDYADASAAAAFVRDRPEEGPVMVFETPLINLLSDREPATPIHGFNWSWLLPDQYEETLAQLRASPPPFVFIGTNYEERVRTLSPGVYDLLAERYRVAWESRYGQWYALRSPLDGQGGAGQGGAE